MQLNLIGRHIEITPALKSFVDEKLIPLEKRYSHINTINITLQVEHLTHIAEGTIHLNGTEIHATAKDTDMYKAIELLIEKLLGQVTKHKEKVIEHHR